MMSIRSSPSDPTNNTGKVSTGKNSIKSIKIYVFFFRILYTLYINIYLSQTKSGIVYIKTDGPALFVLQK